MNYTLPDDEKFRAHFSQRRIQPEEEIWLKVQKQIHSEKRKFRIPVKSAIRIAAIWCLVTGLAAVTALYLTKYNSQYANTISEGTERNNENTNYHYVNNNLSAAQTKNEPGFQIENTVVGKKSETKKSENIIVPKMQNSELSESQKDITASITNSQTPEKEKNSSLTAYSIVQSDNTEIKDSEQSIIPNTYSAGTGYKLIKKPKINPAVLLAAVDTENQSGIINKTFKSLQTNAENLLAYVGDRNKNSE